MTNKNDDDSAVGKTITMTDGKGKAEEFEVVNVRSGDEIQKGSFVVEVKPKSK